MAKKASRKGKAPQKKASKKVAKQRSSALKKRSKARKAKAPKKSTPRRVTGQGRGTRSKAKVRKAPKKLGPSTRLRAGPSTTLRAGGTGRESTLAQTPTTGRSVQGRTNPMPTKRSTGTAAGAGDTRRVPGLERERKRLREVEESVQSPPSSLDMDRHGSAARSGRAALRHSKHEHTETSPAMTGGDVDADWEEAYAVGDEAPGGDNPTPDQDVVDEIGAALGVTYQDDEELKAADKIIERDRHRWELDPASAEDYTDHDKD
jgi:Family of unknown function (DUF6335)